jgi:hypothetical protein
MDTGLLDTSLSGFFWRAARLGAQQTEFWKELKIMALP